MIVKCRYFKLKEEKIMKDGYFISPKQKLLYICTEENFMQFETIDDSDIKRIFWAKENEVDFVEENNEDRSVEKIAQREKYISGIWL